MSGRIPRRSFSAASQTFTRLSRNHRLRLHWRARTSRSFLSPGKAARSPLSSSLRHSSSLAHLKNVLKNQNSNAFIAALARSLARPRLVLSLRLERRKSCAGAFASMHTGRRRIGAMRFSHHRPPAFSAVSFTK